MIHDGGPAFSMVTEFCPLKGIRSTEGMSLLNYFAGQVVPSIIGNQMISQAVCEMKRNATEAGVSAQDFEKDFEFPMYASAAFGIAKAMVAESLRIANP